MPSALICTSVVLSYLLGAVPFGYFIARARGVNIFSAGSGNIGATNVGRVLGRKLGVLVFVLDFLKGAIPTAIMARAFGAPESVAAGLAAVIGHMFPIYLRFRGGKGVATGFGVVVVLLPGPALVAVLLWLTVLATTRYMSLASMLGALALALTRLMTSAAPFAEGERILTGFSLVAAALVVARHRANLFRLARGQENRIGDSPRLHMLARVLHVLALGLWFGAGVFFTFFVALSLFHTFEGLAQTRPPWLPLPADFTREQGTRFAGVAVAPIFPMYFAFQAVCGLVAVVTAWGWTGARVHRVRYRVLTFALLPVLLGWMLLGKVSEARIAVYAVNPADRSSVDLAESNFMMLHTISLALNMSAIALAGVGLALAACLPNREGPAGRRTDLA